MEALIPPLVVVGALVWWALRQNQKKGDDVPWGDKSGGGPGLTGPTQEVAPVGSPAVLVVVQGPLRGRRVTVPLRPKGLTLGRGDGCDLQLGGTLASRKHAALTLDSGRWVLYDLNSVNGTYVNDRQVASASLSAGDFIEIGDSKLQFWPDPRVEAPIPSQLPPPPPPPVVLPAPPGFAVPGYEGYIWQEIARGATAVVLRGLPPGGGVPVAVKLLASPDPYFRDKFGNEGQLLMRIRHPHIVPAYASGQTQDGRPYIVMEYCAHGSLHDRLRGQPLPEEFVRLVGGQVGQALAFAHQQHVVHRDVKPANLLFAGPQLVKVADFGIARYARARSMTVHGTILGTYLYMAPEQARGEPVGPEGDVYSLGVVLYQMMAGRPPFTGEAVDVMDLHVKAAPAPLQGYSPALTALVHRALDKTPARRPSAQAMADALAGRHVDVGPLPQAVRLRLVRLAPQRAGVLTVAAPVTVLGRPQLDSGDASMSREHCRITIRGNLCWIEDLNSANGTWVNHRRVVDRQALRSGDELRIGSTIARVEVEA
ncbi:MAG: FHA domain-containing protein [Anaerolineae bacterium]